MLYIHGSFSPYAGSARAGTMQAPVTAKQTEEQPMRRETLN